MGCGTVVTPGNKRRVQVRKARKDGFGQAKRRIVLDLARWPFALKR